MSEEGCGPAMHSPSDDSGSVGLGFATPTDTVTKVLPSLEDGAES
ncbi:hypothetical protein [Streptomyces fractus]